jgi:hypothetical protein
LFILLERLSDAGNIPVAENSEATGEKRNLAAISLDILIPQKRNQTLCAGETSCHRLISRFGTANVPFLEFDRL